MDDRDFAREFPLTAASMRSKDDDWVHPDDEPKPGRRPRVEWLTWICALLIVAFIVFVFTQTSYWPR